MADTGKTDALTVGIVLFDKVEELDFVGPLEVFAMAGSVTNGSLRVVTVAERADAHRPIVASHGMRVIPDHTLDDAPHLDLLVVPGGMGTRVEVANPRLIGWIKRRAAEAQLVTSVCTGSFLLAETGMLAGKTATTHWASVERMRETYTMVTVRGDARYVTDGDIVTSAGISAGIDMSLAVVSRLRGEKVAEEVARRMEYDAYEPEGA